MLRSLVALGYAADTVSYRVAEASIKLPPQVVVRCLHVFVDPATEAFSLCIHFLPQFIEPRSFAVLPNNFSFRTNSLTQYFNPTNATPPVFQVFDQAFLEILGPDASIVEIASNAAFAFAHEAPVYVAATDEVFFASNDGGPLGNSDLDHNNMVSKLSLTDTERALQRSGGKAVNMSITHVCFLALLFHLEMSF